jgi:hypothetical protein
MVFSSETASIITMSTGPEVVEPVREIEYPAAEFSIAEPWSGVGGAKIGTRRGMKIGRDIRSRTAMPAHGFLPAYFGSILQMTAMGRQTLSVVFFGFA